MSYPFALGVCLGAVCGFIAGGAFQLWWSDHLIVRAADDLATVTNQLRAKHGLPPLDVSVEVSDD